MVDAADGGCYDNVRLLIAISSDTAGLHSSTYLAVVCSRMMALLGI